MCLRYLRLLSAGISLVLLPACSTLVTPPICEHFEGVQAALERESHVSILVVHGMSGYSEGDPHSLISGITSELGLRPDGASCDRQIIRESPYKNYGCLERQDYSSPYCPYHLSVYVLDWRPTTWEEKSDVRCLDKVGPPGCGRLKFINKLKNDFIDNGLGDVLLYLGNYADEIRYPFEQSIRWVYQDSKDFCQNEIYVVSFSMGGEMFLDALDDMRVLRQSDEDDRFAVQVREAFIAQMSGFFMLSNQIPLFELGHVKPQSDVYHYRDADACDECPTCDCSAPLPEVCGPSTIDWPSTAVGQFVQEKHNTCCDFKIISISDPNDLLTYPWISCSNNELPAAYFTDVCVRNVKTSYFGLINPARAHQGYGHNACVVRMIAHGH